MNIEQLEKSIGYKFKDKTLLETALTHTSYANEKKKQSNEKLEYLGDAILEFVISKYLFINYKNLTEGEMTKVRASVVCEQSLYEIAKKHNFNDYLYLGKSERINGEVKRVAILADSVEAIIAAMYLDSNLEIAQKFILENLKNSVKNASKNVGMKDYKTVLQEKMQENGSVNIEYKVIKEEGPDHDKKFTVELIVNDKKISEGIGKSKKEAEMQAAKKALDN